MTAEDYYVSAFNEMSDMLARRDSLSIKRKAMVEAGIPVSEPTMVPSYTPMSTPFGIVDVFSGYQIKCDFNIMPSSAFKSIIQWNPAGQYLRK